jgi:hypothetical protein
MLGNVVELQPLQHPARFAGWGIDLTQRLQDRRVRRCEKKLFGVSDMHPDVRPRDIHRQTVGREP